MKYIRWIALLLVLCMAFAVPVAAMEEEDWLWPVPGSFQINSLDYYNNGNIHSQGQSMDIGSNGFTGEQRLDVVSCTPGVVTKVVTSYPDVNAGDGSWGNYVSVRHNGNNIVYAHLKSVSQEALAALESGQPIAAGTKLGLMGTSGQSTGVHLHLQVYSADVSYAKEDPGFIVFDEFIDNPDYFPKFTFWSGLEKYSVRYGEFIRRNYTASNGVYFRYTGDDPNTVSTSMSPWAVEEISYAVDNGLIPDTLQFNYKNYISRLDFCRLAVRLLETVTDKDIGTVLEERAVEADPDMFEDTRDMSVFYAYALGIVNGRGDGTFDPYGCITRQEAAAMLKRAAGILGVKDANGQPVQYIDQADIADWATGAIGFVSGMTDPTNGKRVMDGLGDGQFLPRGIYTREQAYISVQRMYNAIGGRLY